MDKIREHILLIIIWILTAVAAFQTGVIFQAKLIDNYEKRFTKVEKDLGELSGKVESHEGIVRGIQKGRPIH